IGDVLFRVKGTVWKGEHFGLAAAMDFRAPTGNENDFQGAGTWGVKPFVIASYRGRISPHVNLGYQWNGDSILAGSIDVEHNLSSKGQLPNEFIYTVGADVGIAKDFTFSLDLLGQRFSDAQRLSATHFTDQGDIAGNRHTFADTAQSTGVVNIKDLAAG